MHCDCTSRLSIWRARTASFRTKALPTNWRRSTAWRAGLETAGYAHLRNARNCYDRWGAHGKVKQLDERYPRLREERTPASSATIGPPVGQLDVETVVKASQAISSEMALPALIEKLVRIAAENAGAERGLLILIRDGELRIEAEAITGPGGIEVVVLQAAVTPSDLPLSALHYVIRTQEGVLLDDASADSVYSKDEYVRQKHSRSILCLPIVKQAKLVGALYLENNLLWAFSRRTGLPCCSCWRRRPQFHLRTPASIPICNSRLGCCSVFLYPPGRSSPMGHRTS